MTTLTASRTATAPDVPRTAAPSGRPRPAGPATREGRFQTRARAVYAVMGWLLAASATVLASTGQLEFAREAGIVDLRQFLVPTILEIAVIFVLLGGYLRACDGDSPALMWALAVAITGFATWTNLTHGGPRAGRIFAAATVLTFVLWLLKLRDRYRAARRADGLLDAPTAKFRAIRWLVQPRLTGRAWLIAVEYSLRDADRALARARLWRDTVTDHHDAHREGRWWTRRRAARRAAALAVRAAHAPAPAPAAAAEVTPVGADRVQPVAPGFATPMPVIEPAATTAAPDAVPATTGVAEPAPATAVGDGVADEPGAPGPTGADVPAPDEPGALDGHGAAAIVPDETVVYTPTGEEDAVMYQAWLSRLAAGREPTGAELARAAGRDNDTSGTGRRAARRYRDAHAAASAASAASTPWHPNGHRTPVGADR